MEGDDARPPSRAAPNKCGHFERPSGDLLEGLRGIREGWAKEVGKPHQIGIELNINVRFVPSDEKRIDYQVRGVVDVPSRAFGDDERNYLAKVLLHYADIPRSKYEYAVISWVEASGGDGVRVDKCGPIPHLTDAHIYNVKVFTSPNVEVPDDDWISREQNDEWVCEYDANRYCRFETRQELQQRFQDIWVNTQVLTRSGKVGLTTDKNWYRLQQHVIAEMLRRGEPPRPSNQDPRVNEARPFFDGELCRKAARVVSARGTDSDVLVKYGKREHMEALFQKGQLYLNSATSYNESVHNQAVQDEEQAIYFKGGYHIRGTHPTQFYDRKNPPPKHVADSGAGFRTMYDVPHLNFEQYATMAIRMVTDYWMFCMAEGLDQRLFADFEADSCLIIRRKPFEKRLLMATLQVPNTKRYFGYVQYVDPLGARSEGVMVSRSIPIYMTKVFRYAYQREVRLALLPRRFQERLKPRVLHIGPISDIAELVQLNDRETGEYRPRSGVCAPKLG